MVIDMKPIYAKWLIQIEITNKCNLSCSNCTSGVGHHKETFFMDLESIEKAIDSLEGYKGKIGIMGGEPTMHPQFKEICEIVQRKVPKGNACIFTSGYKWKQYKKLIFDTFGETGGGNGPVFYNDHKGPGKHVPVLIAAEEVINNKKTMWDLINRCWIQECWSASINPKGAFFCEVAAMLDMVLDGPGGYPVEKGWWIKDPEQFEDQMKRYCTRCSAALPVKGVDTHESCDYVSKGNYDLLIKNGSPKALKGDVKIINKLSEVFGESTEDDYLNGGSRSDVISSMK